MILNQGDALLVVHRRLFKDDDTRFFVGAVTYYESALACVRGHTWARDSFAGGFYRKADARTKVISLAAGALLIYLLPAGVELEKLRFEGKDAKLILSDGKECQMDLTEHEFHYSRGDFKPGLVTI